MHFPHVFCIAVSLVGALGVTAGCGSVTNEKAGLPTIATVEPNRGSTTGGTMVTLSGTQLAGGDSTIVLVGGLLATAVTATSDTSLTFEVPAGGTEGEIVDITVSNSNGFVTLPEAFTYNYGPILLDVSPPGGKSVGGTLVTITGRGFMDGGTPVVNIAGSPASAVTVVNDTTLTAMTASVPAGTKPFTPLDVTVTNANGTDTLLDSFQVTAQGLLLIERRSQNRIFYVDPITKTASAFGRLQQPIHGCALNPANGKLYGQVTDDANNTMRLVTFDPLSGEVTTIGETRDAGATIRTSSSLTFVGTTLYGVNSGSNRFGIAASRLMTIDTTTGLATIMGGVPMSIANTNAIAIKDAATVYFADRTDQSLDTIAVGTSVLSVGQPLIGGAARQTSGLVAIAPNLYLSENNNPVSVYSVNPTTGAMTRLAQLPAGFTNSGMCQTPPDF